MHSELIVVTCQLDAIQDKTKERVDDVSRREEAFFQGHFSLSIGHVYIQYNVMETKCSLQ